MFFITCFEKIEIDKYGMFDGGCQRTFGFKETLEDATSSLQENRCDMHETIYNYAVVEKIDAGIHPVVEQEKWFKWDNEKKGFYEIDKPKETMNFINFAFG
jgi:hypothetical protein